MCCQLAMVYRKEKKVVGHPSVDKIVLEEEWAAEIIYVTQITSENLPMYVTLEHVIFMLLEHYKFQYHRKKIVL